MRARTPSILTAFIAATALAACSADSTAPGASPRSVSVAFSTTGATTAVASLASGLQPSAATFSTSTDVLVISKAQLVLARLELQRAGATCPVVDDDADERRDDSSCAELQLAPSIVDLPVDGSATNTLKVDAPAGTYSAFEAKIRPVEAKRSSTAAFLAAHPEMTGASVRVEGTFNGKAFTFTGVPEAELESEFNPPIVADATGASIAVKVDLTNWFRNSSGALVDPSTANVGGPNESLVRGNITRSFRTFEDEDHDGRDDRSGRN